MVLDTGSELSWLHCQKTPATPLYYDPLHSTSYTPVPCNSPICMTQTRDFTIPASCDPKKLCHATLSYADATSVDGNLASDIFRFTDSNLPGVIFGCMDMDSSSNENEDSLTTGLIGMNRGSLSFVTQMGYPKFSYCITGQDSTGVLLFGEFNLTWPRPLSYTPMVKMSTPLPYFDRGVMDLCYRVERSRVGLPVLPSVSMMFRGSEMIVSGQKLLFKVAGMTRGSDDIHCFTFANSDLLGIEAYVIGHHHQQDMWMEFDLANNRVGFAEVRCDSASQKLGIDL
ncbi:hypothetical protein E3N88_03306 [Mikania micrantha]|uniref:Peptidase A1 domain-containing protein n=1 Tax=Mikania micrantha TaxID=192012 RepID=A0A5N6Q8Z8_9ASTR|nr:hypothetical protein E3N88_03306 [Mikania micrantha]